MIRLRTVWFIAVLSIFSVSALTADPVDLQDKLKEYTAEFTTRVQQLDDAAEKREMIEMRLEKVISALNIAAQTEKISQEDQQAISDLKSDVQEKLDELRGDNGYEPVADADLNAFAGYVMQDVEQAGVNIYLSSAAIVIILILLLALAL